MLIFYMRVCSKKNPGVIIPGGDWSDVFVPVQYDIHMCLLLVFQKQKKQNPMKYVTDVSFSVWGVQQTLHIFLVLCGFPPIPGVVLKKPEICAIAIARFKTSPTPPTMSAVINNAPLILQKYAIIGLIKTFCDDMKLVRSQQTVKSR